MLVLLFDIDGTLIRAGGAGSRAMSWTLAETFGVQGSTSGITFSGRTDLAITRDLFAKHGIAFTQENIGEFYSGYLNHLPAALEASDGEVLSGARECLELLSAHGRSRIGLLTGNMRTAAFLKLAHFGLQHYFDFGGYGDETLDRDDVAAAAIDAANAHPSVPEITRIWTIGDTPHDIACARSQQISVVAVATGSHGRDELARHNPDILLSDLSDPAQLLTAVEVTA